MNLLKKLPYPIAGLALGIAALGNLAGSVDPSLKTACGIIAALIVLLIIAKAAYLPKSPSEALSNPLIASSFATFPMALMILSVYLPKGSASLALWSIGLIFHALYIVWFTYRFVIRQFKAETMLPSWFIVYVGIAAASVSAPYQNQKALGMAAFWFALISYLVLLALVSWRMVKKGALPEPARPAIVIYAAPASLLLAGYMNSADAKMMPLVYFLLACSVLFYLFALSALPRLLTLPFYPSFSSFTFPFVISAAASRAAAGFLSKAGSPIPYLELASNIQLSIAAALCLYVLCRYSLFLLQSVPAQAKPAKTKAS